MKRLAIIVLLLLIPCAATAQALIARPPAENCYLATIAPDGLVTVNWTCVDVYAAKKDWQVDDLHSMALVMLAIRDQTIQENLPHTGIDPLRPDKDKR
jgi:hypothetical protein